MNENYMQKPRQQSSRNKAGPARGNIITLTGSNSFGLKRRLESLIEDFVKRYGDLALEKIDASEAETNAVMEAVQSLPFLAARKMVVVRDLSANKETAAAIEQIISSTADSTDFVIYEPLLDKRTAYYKTLKNKTQFEEFNELGGDRLKEWLVEEVSGQGGDISSADADYLIERVGTDQQLLFNEMAKLITYEPHISRITIDLLTEPTPQSKVFDLLDAAFAGNKQRALELYEDQRLQKVEPQAILGLLAWQLQLIALAKYADKRSIAQVARDAKVNPYPLRKAFNLAKKITEERLKNMVSEALEIDYLSKTKSIDVDEALKTYIVTL